MRCLIAAAAVVAVLTSGTANAQRMSREAAVLYCQDVRQAMHLHQMASAGSDVWGAEAEKALDSGKCDFVEGSNKWEIVSINKTAGYAKIAYDIHTKKQKIGFIPYFFVWGMGLDQ